MFNPKEQICKWWLNSTVKLDFMSFQNKTGNNHQVSSSLIYSSPFRTWFFSYLMSRTSLEAPLRLLFWDAPGRSLRGKFGVSCASELRLPLKQRRVVLSFWPSAARSGLPPAVLRFAPASGHKMYRKSHHLLQELIPVLVITHCYKELSAKHVLLTCSLFLLKNVDGYSVQR